MNYHECLQIEGSEGFFRCKCGNTVSYIKISNGKLNNNGNGTYTTLEKHLRIVLGVHPRALEEQYQSSNPILIEEYIVLCSECVEKKEIKVIKELVARIFDAKQFYLYSECNGVNYASGLGHFITILCHENKNTKCVGIFQMNKNNLEEIWKVFRDKYLKIT